jgi:hypothetical protein
MQLIDRESTSLLAQAQQGLNELGVSTAFLSSVNQVAVTQKQIDALLKQQELLTKYGQQTNPLPAQTAGGKPIVPLNSTFADPMRPGATGGLPATTPRPLAAPAFRLPPRNLRESKR